MKLKENKEIKFYGKLPLIFFLCTAVTIAIRTVQIFSYIDRDTGFYTGGEFLKLLLYFLLSAASVLFACAAFFSKKTSEVTLFKKDKSLSTVAGILSISFLYDSMSAFTGAFSSSGSISYGTSVFQSMMLSGTLPQLFQSVFALFSAGYFFIYARGLMTGKDNISRHKILAVAPIGWAGFRLIYRFVEQISYIRVSELLLELVLLALITMFFMAFAQLASGVYVRNARWRIMGIGLPAALISFTINIPRILFAFLKDTDALYSKYPFRVSDFFIALFVIVLAVTLIRKETESEAV